LVERNLAKVEVASSRLVSRSKKWGYLLDSQKTFEKAVGAIANQYIPIMDQIFSLLKEKSLEK
jgi:hypothetical protein